MPAAAASFFKHYPENSAIICITPGLDMEPLLEGNKGYPLSIHRQLIALKPPKARIQLFGCEGLVCSKTLVDEAKDNLSITTMKQIRE